MNVTVRLFAEAREIAGADRLDVRNMRSPCDVSGLLNAVLQSHGAALHAQLTGRDVRAAVNQEFVDLSHLLSDGDEVAFLPPVTGG